MNYPLISEYIEAILFAKDNLATLAHLCPVLDKDGKPVMSSGNFAVVFKMRDEKTDKLYAVKCFLKEQEGREEAYRLIAEELESVSSTFLTPVKYLDKELFVDTNNSAETEFPVLLMDWIEGVTLDEYISKHIDDIFELAMLAFRFSRLAMWLMPQPFAHGDLKPDNILVRKDGTLVLIDYDGMYVPAMKGQKARELGSPDFRHPSRTKDNFDEHIDDFSLISILLSLKAISLQPELLKQYGAADRLLFSAKDYHNLNTSELLREIYPSEDSEINILVSLFTIVSERASLPSVLFKLLYLDKKRAFQLKNLSTKNTYKDLDNAWTDEYDVTYSKDKKKLLGHVSDWAFDNVYKIREGTEIICDMAFPSPDFRYDYYPRCFKTIIIPASVKAIGDKFITKYRKVICKSSHFKWYNKGLYTSDYKTLIYYPYINRTHEILLHPNTERIYYDFTDDVHLYDHKVQYNYYPYCVLYQSKPNRKFDLPDNTIVCVPKGTKELFVKIGYNMSQLVEGCVSIDKIGAIYSNAYSSDTRSPIPMISVHSVGDFLYRRQS